MQLDMMFFFEIKHCLSSSIDVFVQLQSECLENHVLIEISFKVNKIKLHRTKLNNVYVFKAKLQLKKQ